MYAASHPGDMARYAPAMSPPPRRLVVSVGTSLLAASLVTGAGACDGPSVNPGAEPEKPDLDAGAEGAQAQEAGEVTVNTAPEPPPEEPIHTNPGPDPSGADAGPPPELEAPAEQKRVNTGPEPELEKKDEPKHVNTGPADKKEDAKAP